MAASGFTPPSFNWESSDLPDELDRFKQYCELIFQGPFSDKNEKEKVSYTLLWIGRPGVEIYNSVTWDNNADKMKLDKIFKKLSAHLAPKVNPRLARFELQQFRQRPDESVDAFVTRCKTKTRKCQFRDAEEIRDRLVEQVIIGTKFPKVQERLLEKGMSLTLDQALDVARTYEATQAHMEKLTSSLPQSQEHAVHAFSSRSSHPQWPECTRCGMKHHPDKCPAQGTTCDKCGKPNHWAQVCKTKPRDKTGGRSSQQGNARSRPRPHDTGKGPQSVNAATMQEHFDELKFESILLIDHGPCDAQSQSRHWSTREHIAFAAVPSDVPA